MLGFTLFISLKTRLHQYLCLRSNNLYALHQSCIQFCDMCAKNVILVTFDMFGDPFLTLRRPTFDPPKGTLSSPGISLVVATYLLTGLDTS